MNILVIGAGAVGRGLLAPLFASKHDVRFYDTNPRLASELESKRRYPVTEGGDPETWSWITIAGARWKADDVLVWIAQADLILVAVRVENLPAVAGVLARGLARAPRADRKVIAVENTPDAASLLNPGPGCGTFVNAIAECIVPEPTRDMRRRNSLLVYRDPAGYLVVDSRAWTGAYPSLPGVVFDLDFALAWDLKWYAHCALHALVAYLGLKEGHTYIHEAMGDRDIGKRVRAVMLLAETELGKRYPTATERIHARIASEFASLASEARPDPCARVGRDAGRKVQKGERLDALLQLVGGKNATVKEAIAVAKKVGQ